MYTNSVSAHSSLQRRRKMRIDVGVGRRLPLTVLVLISVVTTPTASTQSAAADAPLVNVGDEHHTTTKLADSIPSLGIPPPVSRLRSPELCDTRKAGKKPLAYVHIFHTAGTSLKQVFCCSSSCTGTKGPRETYPPVIGIDNCPAEYFHHSLEYYRKNSLAHGINITTDEDMFTFAVMRDPLPWFESLFVHALQCGDKDCAGKSERDIGIDWRHCLGPMRDLASERVRLEKTQSISAFETAKVHAFRKWIEILTTTVPSARVLQTQSWLNMQPGDTRRPVDCLVNMQIFRGHGSSCARRTALQVRRSSFRIETTSRIFRKGMQQQHKLESTCTIVPRRAACTTMHAWTLTSSKCRVRKVCRPSWQRVHARESLSMSPISIMATAGYECSCASSRRCVRARWGFATVDQLRSPQHSLLVGSWP